MNEIANDQADEQCQRGDEFEVEQRLTADAADLPDILHAGDAGYDGAKNDQGNDHSDEPDESIPQRLHGDSSGGAEISERYGEDNSDEDLYPEMGVKGFFGHRPSRLHQSRAFEE